MDDPKGGSDSRAEYRRSDLGDLVRGKYAHAVPPGSNVVTIAPDLVATFPDERAVNAALRELLALRARTGPDAPPAYEDDTP